MATETALRVLLADDRPDVLEALRLLLKGAGYTTEAVDSPAGLLRAVETREYDLILMDLNYTRDTTSGAEGLDLLDHFHSVSLPTPVIVMTAWGSIDLAVEAMRRGACDFIQKPWDNARVLATLEKQARAAADRRAAERIIRNELEIALEVQQNLFPHHAREYGSVAYAGRCVPARAVGGDYYDFFDLGDETLGLALADVSGKGTTAALLLANLQGSFRTQIDSGAQSLRALLRGVNRTFFESTPAAQFATAFFARYDGRARRLEYVNCGHLPPALMRCSGGIERLEPSATILGAFRTWDCEEHSVAMRPGDTLVIFSDGITESANGEGEEFGEARVLTIARQCRDARPADLVEALIGEALRFSPREQFDDISVVAACAR